MAINKQRLLSEFFNLVQLPCPTGNERAAADYLIPQLKELGAAEIIEDPQSRAAIGNTGDIVANFPGNAPGAPTIFLAAHMDCVPNCIGVKPQLVDGVIKSDGTTILGADDKSGVAAIMEVMRCLKEQAIPHGAIQVIFTVSEEIELRGSRNIDRSLLKADFGYVMDSSGLPGKIVCSAPGYYIVKGIIHGVATHGATPEKGVNAIKKANLILAGVPDGRIDEETTCNMGFIRGGTAINIVPERVEVEIDCRSRNPEKLEALVASIRTAFEEGAKKYETPVDVEAVKHFNSFVLDKDCPCVKLAAEAAAEVGLTPDFAAHGGGSDANIINGYGIPCTVLGTGMTNVHTVNEFIRESDLYATTEWLLALVKKCGQLA